MSRTRWLALVGLLGVGCITPGRSQPSHYDHRSVSMQTLNLFNQRRPSGFTRESWKGDWLYRRERLEVIDSELRNSRPDLVMYQELMEKRNSGSESDRAILGYGALRGYEWSLALTGYYSDTQEDEYQGVAVGLPLKIAGAERPLQERLWTIGPDGFLSLTVVELDEQPIYVFSVQMPDQENLNTWYSYLEEIMKRIVQKDSVCLRRVVVAGYLPGGASSKEFASLLRSLEMKDTGVGHGKCEVASDCYTGTPLNELFMVTSGSVSPAQFDRILVHESAALNYSGVIYNAPASKESVLAAKFGMTKLWPTRRFGWTASVRFARCS